MLEFYYYNKPACKTWDCLGLLVWWLVGTLKEKKEKKVAMNPVRNCWVYCCLFLGLDN